MAEKTGVPEYWANTDEQLRKVSQVVNRMLRGKTNAAAQLTLSAAPATQTELIRADLTTEMHAQLSPLNAAAAADFALGTTYAVVTEGKVTVNHAASAGSRLYGLVFQG